MTEEGLDATLLRKALGEDYKRSPEYANIIARLDRGASLARIHEELAARVNKKTPEVQPPVTHRGW